MDVLLLPPPVREKLGNPGSDGLVTMFADAHKIAMKEMTAQLDRRMAISTESFERRLAEETGKLRVDIANMKFELVKWMFLFWVGQLAISISVLSWMLRGIR